MRILIIAMILSGCATSKGLVCVPDRSTASHTEQGMEMSFDFSNNEEAICPINITGSY